MASHQLSSAILSENARYINAAALGCQLQSHDVVEFIWQDDEIDL